MDFYTWLSQTDQKLSMDLSQFMDWQEHCGHCDEEAPKPSKSDKKTQGWQSVWDLSKASKVPASAAPKPSGRSQTTRRWFGKKKK